MRSFFTVLVWLAGTLGFLWARAWTDGYHLIAAACLLGGVLPAVAWLRRRGRLDDDPVGLDEEPLPGGMARPLVAGLALALLSAAWLWAGLAALERVPWIARRHDADWPELRTRVDTLTAAGSHDEAARLLRERLRGPASPALQHELAARLQGALLRAGEARPDLDGTLTRLREAVDISRLHRLDGQLASVVLARAEREEDLRRRAGALRAGGRWGELTADLRAALKERRASPWKWPIAQELHDGLVAWGRSCPNPDDRVCHFQAARAVAAEHGLKGDLAASLLEGAEQEAARDRELVARVEALRAEKRWQDLAALLRLAVAKQPRSDRRQPLERWLLDALCRAGDTAGSPEERLGLYGEAVALAEQEGLDPEPAASRRQLLLKEVGARTEMESTLKRLRERRAHQELATLLRVTMEARPRQEWTHPFDALLAQALIEWGDGLTELEEKRVRYQEADRVARAFGLKVDVADRLKRVEADIARRDLPRELPRGARAGLMKVDTGHYPPVLMAELWVEDGAGQSLDDLRAKDFRVDVAGRAVKQVQLAPIRKDLPPLHVVLALDTSGSTAHVLELAKEGARALLRSLGERQAAVRVLRFSKEVHTCCDWTPDLARAAAALGPLAAEGNTALYQALAAGVAELKGREGERIVVVFTDGKDTVGGLSLDAVVAACREAGTAVYAVGLRTQELDAPALRRLAGATGGMYAEAARQEDLMEQYLAASRRIRRSFYRLVFSPEAGPGADVTPPAIRIQVGGNNGVVVSAADRP